MTPRTYSDGLRDAARMARGMSDFVKDEYAALMLSTMADWCEDTADAAIPPPPIPSTMFWLGEQGA